METAVLKPETSTQADVTAVTAKVSAEKRFDDLTNRLAKVQSEELRKLLDRQNELIARVNALANIKDADEAARGKEILEANLAEVREEIAKRTENVGVMAAELMALYDELGLQAQKADETSPEDERKRGIAQKRVEDAVTAVASARAAIIAAEAKVAEAKNGWWPFGKQARIEAAKAAAAKAEAEMPRAEAALEDARTNVLTVDAQIEIDKADRIRRASLAENFAMIRQFTGNAINVLRDDVEQTTVRIDVTQKALTSALTKKAEVARELDKLRDDIAKKERDLERETRARDEIPDQGSEAYAIADGLVKQLDGELTEMTGRELELNTRLMALTAAAEANSSSFKGLTVQRDTARVYIVKLETAEKTAEILGHNIDRMVKNTTQETASDALDRAADKMIFVTIELGEKAKIASAKAKNEALERHRVFMEQAHAIRTVGDEAMAIEAQRYIELDEKIRAGYAEQGIDVNLSHLVEAAATVGQPRRAPAEDGEVTY